MWQESDGRVAPDVGAGVYERLDWEYLTFAGTEAGIDIHAHGYAFVADAHFVGVDGYLELVGRPASQLQAFDARITVPGPDALVMGRRVETRVSDVRRDDPFIVATDDPTHPDLPATFWHLRGDRIVLVGDVNDTLVA